MPRPADARVKQATPPLAMAGSMISVTAGASLAESIFPSVGPAGVTALRIVMGTVILSCVFRIWRVRFNAQQIRAVLPYGLSLGCMNLLFYTAIQRIPLGVAIAVEFTGPLCLTLMSSRRMIDFGWMGLASTGLLLLLPLQTTTSEIDPVGVCFALGAGVFWAAYIITGKRAGAAVGGKAAALGMIVASIIVAPVGLAIAGRNLFQLPILSTGLGVALLSSAIPYPLEMFALRRLPTRTFGVLVSSEPAIGALIGMMLLGETLPMIRCLGIAAIMFASIGATISAGREIELPAESLPVA